MQIEDRFPSELQLAAEKRGVEGRIDGRVGQGGDCRRGVGGLFEPGPAAGGVLEEECGEVRAAEVLNDLAALEVVRMDLRNPQAGKERLARREPAAPGVGLLGRVEDPEDALAARQQKPEIAAPPDVPRQDLDRDRLIALEPDERRQTVELGGNHGGVSEVESES